MMGFPVINAGKKSESLAPLAPGLCMCSILCGGACPKTAVWRVIAIFACLRGDGEV